MNFRLLVIPFISVLLTACGTSRSLKGTKLVYTRDYKAYKIDNSLQPDTTLTRFLNSYSTEVHRQMNVVIGETETPLERKMPEGTLGNFVADAMLQTAKIAYNRNVDCAFVNYGGLRVDNIAAGPVVLGKIYELMPFDNLLVLQQLTGDQLLQFLDFIAAKKGWPAAGINMQIRDGKAVNITVNGKAVNKDAMYTIATTDYTASGNEGADVLKNIKQVNKGYLFRDALIDYVKELTRQGKKINATIENRITNAE